MPAVGGSGGSSSGPVKEGRSGSQPLNAPPVGALGSAHPDIIGGGGRPADGGRERSDGKGAPAAADPVTGW